MFQRVLLNDPSYQWQKETLLEKTKRDSFSSMDEWC